MNGINFGLSHQQLFKMGGVTGYGKYFMGYKPLQSLTLAIQIHIHILAINKLGKNKQLFQR